MAGDSSDPTCRKHRRSPSDDENDSQEPSKRRKHRHHRHHRHHHRHHHRSKKEDRVVDSTQIEAGIEEKEKRQGDRNDSDSDMNDTVAKGPPIGGIGSVANGLSLGIDYDMEEGEIIEEVEVGAEGDDGKKKRGFDSDTEAGEVEGNGFEKVNVSQEVEESVKRKSKEFGILGMDRADREEVAITDRKKHSDIEKSTISRLDHASNGEFVHHYFKDVQPVEEHQRTDSKYVSGYDLKHPSESGGSRLRGVSNSHSHGRVLEEGHGRQPVKSPGQSRGRSQSQSSLHEASQSDTPKEHDDAYHSKRKHRSDSDDEQVVKHDRVYRHGSRDLLMDRETERSSSYSRHNSRMDRHHSRETRERDREGSREMDRDRTRERERARERQREREREREREKLWDRERRRDLEREERERRRERDRDSLNNRSRDRDRERENDRSIRHRKHDDLDDGYDDRSRPRDSRSRRYAEDDDPRDSLRGSDIANIDNSLKTLSERDKEKLRRDEQEQEAYQERIELQLAEQEEDDLEKIKEESRRRRQAILEKYKSQKLQEQPENKVEAVKEQVEQQSMTAPAVHIVPEVDGRKEVADDLIVEPSFSVGKSPQPNGLSARHKPSDAGGLGAGSPKSEKSADMFTDDIFGESPTGVRKTGKGDGLAIERSGLHDNWDDPEGYYSYRFGELLDGRYEIVAAHGKGVFSTVVRAKDLKAKFGDPEEVAIKIIRSNETMYKAGMDELVILKKLAGADPENKRHCVRFISTFKYRNHLCLVFESLHMNLREVLKKFGRNIGLKLTAVRAYAKQLFISLKHLKNCGVLHCDIKPDNMLVNEAKNVLKLCDFGNAMFAGKNEVTPYLVSRFYRAPEIILGLPYDHPLDMWSVGCCLFELYTGKVLFPGPTNNDMLRLHMELKGPFPKKMLRKGAFTDRHFDQDLNFLATEEDPVTKKAIKRLILNVKPKDMGTLIVGSPGEDLKMLAHFKDILEKIFALDPDKRITVSQALSHPFITGK